MKRLTVLIVFFISFSVAAQEPLINRYEYWFNQHFDVRKKVSVAPSSGSLLQLNLIVNDLPVGLNVLGFRFGDTQGQLSSPLQRYFYKIPQVALAGQQEKKIVGFEYGFNQGKMVFSPAEGTTVFHLDEVADISRLADGLNVLNIRFLDNSGWWSPVKGHFFLKIPMFTTPADMQRKITAYQYRFNSGSFSTVYVASLADFSIDDAFNVEALPVGLNAVYMRFRNNTGKWSLRWCAILLNNPLPSVKVILLPAANIGTITTRQL